jgi:acyl-CoA reductase-like NAD-dependent aldehyde dehydrogenase
MASAFTTGGLTRCLCRALAARFEAGMASINDLTSTYMCQSLPFGGVKQSGFDRFAGRCLLLALHGVCWSDLHGSEMHAKLAISLRAK